MTLVTAPLARPQLGFEVTRRNVDSLNRLDRRNNNLQQPRFARCRQCPRSGSCSPGASDR